jgi:hypothetical protein
MTEIRVTPACTDSPDKKASNASNNDIFIKEQPSLIASQMAMLT